MDKGFHYYRHNHIICFLFILSFINFGCSKKPKEDIVFKKVSNECLAQAIPNQYVVKWLDGSISLIHAKDRDTFIKDVVTPHLEDILIAEENFKIRHQDLNLQANVSAANEVPNNWGIEVIQAQELWKQNIWGDNIRVAVIDSGVDIEHPSLKENILTNPGEMGIDSNGKDKRYNNIDDDQNGFIDDYNGYDFTTDSGDVYDHSFHGTHVSGIIAGIHNDTEVAFGHLQGVAPNSKILPISFIGSDGSGSLADAIRAIDYASVRKVHIINASWGEAPCSQLLGQRIQELASENILFVTASGNSGINLDMVQQYPASYKLPSQITVGAVGKLDEATVFSNYGDLSVHLFAPGSNIISSVPQNGANEAQFRSFSGTSMATPFVAGAAALIWSAHPEWTSSMVKEEILRLVFKSPSYRNITKGRLNLFF